MATRWLILLNTCLGYTPLLTGRQTVHLLLLMLCNATEVVCVWEGRKKRGESIALCQQHQLTASIGQEKWQTSPTLQSCGETLWALHLCVKSQSEWLSVCVCSNRTGSCTCQPLHTTFLYSGNNFTVLVAHRRTEELEGKHDRTGTGLLAGEKPA